MHAPHHHHLLRTSLKALRPTQMTVGMAEVDAKRQEWSKLRKSARADLLASHWFPAVLGPDKKLFIVDHHHLGLALWREGIDEVFALLLSDLSYLQVDCFWRIMEHHNWAHPFGASGQRRPFSAIPERLSDLVDDPYRALAGMVRRAGGYAKETEPFCEFLWADYFRDLLSAEDVAKDPTPVVGRAMELARLPTARYLPGWTGDHSGLKSI